MAAQTLSYAQTLRVIGQHLDGLNVDSFELIKNGDEYVVRIDSKEPTGKSSERSLLKSVAEKIWRSDKSPAPRPNAVRFTAVQVIYSDIENQFKRRDPNAMPDARNLSLTLRVLGDYLDRRVAGDFAISWSTNSVRASYGQKVESFTLENLYDLGVRMYLKRSSRISVK